MKTNLLVKDIMTKEVITLQLDDSLELAEKLFDRYKIRHIPVIKSGLLKGMVSKTDLMRISFLDSLSDTESTVDEAIYQMFSVEQIMIKNVQTVHLNTSVKEATELFITKEYHALPVVDNDKLVGIITTTDILRHYLNTCGC
ncbi:MAG: CBS domain-containing protein [Flavobacteriaceae bacterium]|jgi:CBS domain-containing protein|nr:CBS domain-containing protein [Flavobacteriaceae bacterium]